MKATKMSNKIYKNPKELGKAIHKTLGKEHPDHENARKAYHEHQMTEGYKVADALINHPKYQQIGDNEYGESYQKKLQHNENLKSEIFPQYKNKEKELYNNWHKADYNTGYGQCHDMKQHGQGKPYGEK